MDYLMILLVVAAVYHKTIFFDLVADDIHRLKNKFTANEFKAQLMNIFSSRRYLTKSLKTEHAINIAIHALVCMAVYKLFGNLTLAFLFAIHPLTNQVSVWLNGKRFGVATLFLLLSIIYPPAAIIFYPVALVFNASALPAPILIWATTGNPLYLLLFILGAIVIKYVPAMGTTSTSLQEARYRLNIDHGVDTTRFSIKKIAIYFKTFRYYFMNTLFAPKLGFYHEYMEDYGSRAEANVKWHKWDWSAYSGLILWLSGLSVCIWMWGTPISIGILWFGVTLSLWCNVPYSITQPITERRMYLPLIGFLYALLDVISLASPEWQLAICAALAGYYVARNYQVQGMYRDFDTFNRYNTFYFPSSFSVRRYMTKAYMDLNLMFHAIAEADTGLAKSPEDVPLNFYMAATLAKIGYFIQAKPYWEKAMKCNTANNRDEVLEFLIPLGESIAKGLEGQKK